MIIYKLTKNICENYGDTEFRTFMQGLIYGMIAGTVITVIVQIL